MHQQHSSQEIGKTLLVIIGVVAFVIIALTWVPEWIAPPGGPGAPDVGKTVRMVQ